MVLNRSCALVLLLSASAGCGDVPDYLGLNLDVVGSRDSAAPPDTGGCDDTRWAETTAVDSIDPTMSASGTLGTALLSPGDLTGDGEVELLAGNPSTEDGAGQLVILTGPLTPGSSARGDQTVVHITGQPGDGLGASLAVAHEIHKEDSLDLVLGLPKADDLLLLWGPLDATTGELAGSLRVESEVDSFGSAVASGWGIDQGTGSISDVVVGAPEDEDDAGSVWLIEGSDLRTVADDGEVELSTLSHRTFVGAAGDLLGTALSMGDLSGDGYAELIVGAPGAERAWVLSGDELAATALRGDEPDGASESQIADVALGALVSDIPTSDCALPLGSVIAMSPEDGLIALGAPCLTAMGHTTGGVLLYDITEGIQAETPPTLRVLGTDRVRPIGGSVALAHLDCDEQIDLAIGAAESYSGTSATGAWIVPNLPGLMDAGAIKPSDVPGATSLTGTADGRWNVAAAGDPDGDRQDELLLARPTRSSGGALWLLPASADGGR